MEVNTEVIKKIDLYKEPLKILARFENKGYTGMSDFELAFLCGAIKAFRPKKIVEVGVAAGGTTAVILNCLKSIGCICEIYSVDVCEQCYLDISKKTGFIAEEMLKEELIDTVKHEFVLGNTIAAALDRIGGDIDFVILDTMHSLPGELLDFISLYHSLDKKAVVIFHDIGQSQLGIGNINGAPFEYASLVTLATTMGEKFILPDHSRIAGLSNIGGMRLNKEILCSIDNLFLGLFINWNYIPDIRHLEEYRQRIKKEYDEQYYQMFEQAIECNMFFLYRRQGLEIPLKTVKDEFENVLKKAEKIYIYGAGKIGREVEKYIRNCFDGKKIRGHIISDKKMNTCDDVIELSEIENMDCSVIILGLHEKYHLEVLNSLYQKGLSKYVFPYNGIGFRELMKVIEYENRFYGKFELYENVYGYEQSIREGYRY